MWAIDDNDNDNTLSAVATMAANANGDQDASVAGRWNDNEHGEKNFADVDLRGVSSSDPPAITETLARKLSGRQVQMIAIAGESCILYTYGSI